MTATKFLHIKKPDTCIDITVRIKITFFKKKDEYLKITVPCPLFSDFLNAILTQQHYSYNNI